MHWHESRIKPIVTGPTYYLHLLLGNVGSFCDGTFQSMKKLNANHITIFPLIPSAICESWKKHVCKDVTPWNFLSDSCVDVLNRYMDQLSLPHSHHKPQSHIWNHSQGSHLLPHTASVWRIRTYGFLALSYLLCFLLWHVMLWKDRSYFVHVNHRKLGTQRTNCLGENSDNMIAVRHWPPRQRTVCEV